MSYSEPMTAPEAAASPSRVGPHAPVSTVPYRDGYLGLAGFCAAWLTVMVLRPEPLGGAWLILLGTALPMLALELRRAAPAARGRQGFAPLAWVLGFLLATLPFFAFHAQASDPLYWVLAWAVAAPAFLVRFALERARNGALTGGFPVALGRALLPPSREKLAALAAPARLWALKAIFIPLYGLSLYALVQLTLGVDLAQPTGWLVLAVLFAYSVDLAFGLSGYLFASNQLTPTVRSTQRLLVGWVVCLACYGPVIAHWPAFEAVVRAEIGWPSSVAGDPLGIAAAIAMLVLLALYASASVHFGLRFSNLSNRGVLAAGPYRLMKHPAYFAHAANAWILALVLMPASGVDLGVSQWLVPIAFTVLYWARARTEEMHMREDPDYVAYADWIARHGLLARARRLVGL